MSGTPLQLKIFLSCLFVIACACTRSFQEEIKEVEQLRARIEESKKKFDRLDSAEISTAYFHAKGQIATIQNTYSLSQHTLDIDRATILKNYANLIEPLRQAPQLYADTRSEILLTEKLLANLKHDLKRNLLSEEAVNTALKAEKQAVEQIEAAIAHLDTAFALADSAVPAYNLRIDSLLQLNNMVTK